MRRGLSILILALAARVVTAQPSLQLCEDAAKAYDGGRFGDAEKLYREVLERGETAPALFYNLGNALFKQGRFADAVLAYRRAWYGKPRDADIRANLRFAQQETGGTLDDEPAWRQALLYLSVREWRGVLLTGYWAAALLLIAHLATGRRRGYIVRAAVFMGCIALVGATGLACWASVLASSEAVILQGPQQALYAPIAGSTPHFSLPSGSIVRVDETSGAWLKIHSGDREGWIPSTSCVRVLDRDTASLPTTVPHSTVGT